MKSIFEIHEVVNRDLGKPAFQFKNVANVYQHVDHDEIFKFIEICIYDLPSSLSMNDLEHVRLFFNSLQHVFPCEGCRQRLQRIMRSNPPKFTNKKDVMDWYFGIKDQWEKKHASPRNYLLLKFKNKNHFYVTPISHYNIQKINDISYNNEKMFAIVETYNHRRIPIHLFPTVQFTKSHEVEFAKMKNKIDIETFMKFNSMNPKTNFPISFSNSAEST